MKNALGFLIVVLLLGAGYYFLFPRAETEEHKGTLAGRTIEVEDAEITSIVLGAAGADGPLIVMMNDDNGTEYTVAVPSSSLPLCDAFLNIADPYVIEAGDRASVRGFTDEVGRIVPCARPAHYFTVTRTVQNAEYGFSFSYPQSPRGYVLESEGRQFSDDPEFLYGLRLIPQEAYEELQSAQEPREGPPTIELRIYQNPDGLTPREWIDRKPLESNIALAPLLPEETRVAGENAVTYRVDGLYPTDIYVTLYQGSVYVLSGSYYDAQSAIYSDFREVIKTFSFTPPSL